MTIHGIVPLAALTVAGGLVLFAGLLRSLGARDGRYIVLLLVPLPLSAIVNVVVKRPLISGFTGTLPTDLDVASLPLWFLLPLLFVAPLTEEALKVLPLVQPAVRAIARGRDALLAGFALGVGFGLGEAIYVAFRVADRPEYSQTEWFLFTGYAAERLTACFIHGVLTAIVVRGVSEPWPAPLRAFATAVALHALVNVGPLLYQAGRVSAEVAWVLVAPTLILLALLWERSRRELVLSADGGQELYRRQR